MRISGRRGESLGSRPKGVRVWHFHGDVTQSSIVHSTQRQVELSFFWIKTTGDDHGLKEGMAILLSSTCCIWWSSLALCTGFFHCGGWWMDCPWVWMGYLRRWVQLIYVRC